MANESPYFWTCQKCRYRNSKLAQQCFSCRNRNPNEQITKKSTLPSSSSKTSTTLLNDQHHRRSYVTNNNNNVLTTKIKNQQIRTNQLLPTTKRSSQTTTTTNQNTRIIPIQISQQKQQNSYIKSNPKTLATIQETTKSTNNQQPQPQQSNQMSEVFESFRRNVRRKITSIHSRWSKSCEELPAKAYILIKKTKKDYKRLLSSHRSAPFIDPEFPTNRSSLYRLNEDFDPRYDRLIAKWLRIGELEFERSPNDINDDDGGGEKFQQKLLCVHDQTLKVTDFRQGKLGNCWLLSSLASLVYNYPERLNLIIPDKQLHPRECCYQIILCLDGHWSSVIIDDFFPCDQSGRLVFTEAFGHHLFAPMIEKALAKHYSCYKALILGHTIEGFSTLTGMPVFTIRIDASIRNSLESRHEFWIRLRNLIKVERYLAAASCSTEKDGLFKAHAYSVLDIYMNPHTFDCDQNGILLANPWGDQKLTGELLVNNDYFLKQLEHKQQNGLFWISLIDFLNYFDHLDVCKFSNDWYIRRFEFRLPFQIIDRYNFTIFELNCRRKTVINFTIYQRIDLKEAPRLVMATHSDKQIDLNPVNPDMHLMGDLLIQTAIGVGEMKLMEVADCIEYRLTNFAAFIWVVENRSELQWLMVRWNTNDIRDAFNLRSTTQSLDLIPPKCRQIISVMARESDKQSCQYHFTFRAQQLSEQLSSPTAIQNLEPLVKQTNDDADKLSVLFAPRIIQSHLIAEKNRGKRFDFSKESDSMSLKCDQEWAKKLSKTDYTRSLCAKYANKEIRTRCPVDQEIMSLIGRTTWNNRKRSILGMKRPGIAKKTKKDEHIRESSDKTGKIPTSIQFGIAGVVTLLSGFFATMSGIFMERGEAKTYALTGSVIGTIIGAAWLTKVASTLKCDQEWAKKLSKTDYTRSICAIYSNKEIRTRCPVDQEIMSLIGRTSWNNRRRRSSGKKYKSADEYCEVFVDGGGASGHVFNDRKYYIRESPFLQWRLPGTTTTKIHVPNLNRNLIVAILSIAMVLSTFFKGKIDELNKDSNDFEIKDGLKAGSYCVLWFHEDSTNLTTISSQKIKISKKCFIHLLDVQVSWDTLMDCLMGLLPLLLGHLNQLGRILALSIVYCVEFNLKKYSNLSHDFSKPTLDHCCFYLENLQCAYPEALKCDPEWAKKLAKTDYTRSLCATYSNKEIRTRCPIEQEIMTLIGRTTWNNRRKRSIGNFYCRLEIAKKCNRKWAKELEQNNYIKHMCKVYSQKELNEKCLFGRQENHKLRDRSFELIRPGLSKKINNTENMEEDVDVDIPNLEIEGFSKTTLIAMSSALTFTSAITAIMSAIFLETGPTKTYLLVGSTMSTAIGGTWLTKEVLRLEN
ncbi:Calpain-15 [Dermatophagoides pteronyssinus]|uniref:Calpain-15 n=1 Tax=Dermatophagoides pteronyssinus TaxID=6956 RepID=A0ABQ8J731_DERPT|nr:Calpain-15 [Dermatophagoides pteronyssinus]